jgi:hypothetical protein
LDTNVEINQLWALAQRCENAVGPDQKLDWDIADAMGEIPEHSIREVGWDYNWYRKPNEYALWKATDSEGRSVSLWQPPRRTASVDEAMKLVPETWWCSVDRRSDGAGLATCTDGYGLDSGTCAGATPALALCVAALRVRSQSGS